jgi:hypothetical protein
LNDEVFIIKIDKMKRILLSAIIILSAFSCMAQEELAYPFQGGKDVMTRFFKDSLVVSPEIKQQNATGNVIVKFTADIKGTVTKIIIYYADDAVFVPAIADVLKKSNHKWIIPDKEKLHDFLISFNFNFKGANTEIRKAYYDYYKNRKPIVANNQIPLDEATLLPPVIVNYGLNKE